MLKKLKKKKMDIDFLYFMNDPDLIVGFPFTISHCHVKENLITAWTKPETGYCRKARL